MNTRKIALAIAAGATLMAAAPAFAHGDRWDHRGPAWRGQYSYHSHYYRAPVVVAPRPYYYAPAPVYYAPAPVYYAPPPRYYGPPAPVVYGSVPVGGARVNFGVRF